MKSFKKFYEDREGLGDISGVIADDAIMQAAKMAVEDHYEETMKFLHKLAQKDERIRNELENACKAKKVVKPERLEVDEIMPPKADIASGEDE